MTPAELSDAVVAALRASVAQGEFTVEVPDSVRIERPKVKAHGDYATGAAMALAGRAGRPSREIAELVAARLRSTDGIARVDVAGPGFLNVTLAEDALGEIARVVVAAGAQYGGSQASAGHRINLEWVSANPTGPMHVGHARWAAVGDSLARLLEATGAAVGREFYVNDAGKQVDVLAQSLLIRARQARGETVEFPPEGYQGDYVTETATAICADHPGLLDESEEKALEVFRREGLERLLAEIRTSLEAFGVRFDVWFSERSGLHESGAIPRAIERLRVQGHVYDEGGAVWLRTTDFGDDKDRVLIRSNGKVTYFAADAAYYLDKRDRGYDQVLIMLGADHHGYVGRMRFIAAAAGDDPGTSLQLLIGQMVNLVQAGVPVNMSRRAGTYVAFDDLVGAVGVDAARYALVRSSTDSTMELDLDLLNRQDNDNPVFYVQYAHARIASLLRAADDLAVRRGELSAAMLGLLSTEREVDLLRALGEFPRVVAGAAELRAPHRVARFLEELAGTYHRFYDSCRVLPQNLTTDQGKAATDEATDLTRARLWLCEATRVVLANGLALLGVSAPARM